MSGVTVEPRFQLGLVVITAVAEEQLLRALGDEEVGLLLGRLLDRHVRGDWGDLESGDHEMNELAVESGDRILSRYNAVVGDIDLYVVTEAAGNACLPCWTGRGVCEPGKGSWLGVTHFRDDLPPTRAATTVMLPSDY